MELKFNVTKETRKNFVAAISEITGEKSAYKGAPSFAFVIGAYTVDKAGTLIYDENSNEADVNTLTVALAERGFVSENQNLSTDTTGKLSIDLPIDGFTETAVDNLKKLIDNKSALIKKAIGTESLQIEITESAICFPWFSINSSPNEIEAYTRFVYALGCLAKKQKRVAKKESDVESEKFAFRCFLLRLGFIGNDYSSARKILLSKLSGSGSFKSGESKKSKA